MSKCSTDLKYCFPIPKLSGVFLCLLIHLSVWSLFVYPLVRLVTVRRGKHFFGLKNEDMGFKLKESEEKTFYQIFVDFKSVRYIRMIKNIIEDRALSFIILPLNTLHYYA